MVVRSLPVIAKDGLFKSVFVIVKSVVPPFLAVKLYPVTLAVPTGEVPSVVIVPVIETVLSTKSISYVVDASAGPTIAMHATSPNNLDFMSDPLQFSTRGFRVSIFNR